MSFADSWADICEDEVSLIEPQIDDDGGWETVTKKKRNVKKRHQKRPVNRKVQQKDGIYRVDKETREAAYSIQKAYGDVSKAARTMLTGEGLKHTLDGWFLRDRDIIIPESKLESDQILSREQPYQISYVKIENEAPETHYIVYVRM